MPSVASRARNPGKGPNPARDSLPPAKKTKLSQMPSAPRQNGLEALLTARSDSRPAVAARLNRGRSNRNDRVDEATAIVSGGQGGHGDVDMADAGKEVIEISSAEEDSDLSASDSESATGADATAPLANRHTDADHQPMEEGSAEPEEPSFGEQLRAQEPDSENERVTRVVHVEAAFVGSNGDARALATASGKDAVAPPSATSFGTVLTQALRTNDQDMLDSCLRANDVDTVYATIERLPSPLVGTLLQKLAERLHRRPGRPGMLMVWVQWSLSAHGGYLATQPLLVKQLATLNKVLKERASGLQPLLSLKGRLDMLQAQTELRRRNQRRSANDDMDEAVIYVEGEEEPYSSAEEDNSEDDGVDVAAGKPRKRIRQDVEDDVESSVDGMPTTMELDEDSEEGSEDSEDLLDDEAEETDDDTGDEISEPMTDDLEDGGIESDSEEESKPARRSTAGRAGLARRP